MFSTAYLLLIFTFVVILTLCLWVGFLKFGLRRQKVSQITFGKLIVAAIAGALLNVFWQALIEPGEDLFINLIYLALTPVLPCLVITRVFNISMIQALQAWLVMVVGAGMCLFVPLYLFHHHLFLFYQIPTNSMAPTLLGKHVCGTCPKCGATSYTSVAEANVVGRRMMICENLHEEEHSNVKADAVRDGDRVFCIPFLSPQRWDLIVFRYPQQPEIDYVKRLVGLPGETIVIKDGSIWADGRKLETPEYLRDVTYGYEEFGFTETTGTPDNPAILGEDEYFTLGDYQSRAMDSRYWERGAPGHPRYAVPVSYVKGVVTHVVWPPRRAKIFR